MSDTIRCGLLCRGAAALLAFVTAASADSLSPPATYHLSFDTFGFLEDDYSARFENPAFERRNLELLPGKFGQALHNDNPFVEADFHKTYMSVRDLDVLLEVICHHRFKFWERGLEVGGMHPYFWGTGRLKTDSGTVAFWAKGPRVRPGSLFFQGSSSFGRLEKYLLGIDLHEDRTLEAYVVDARYVRHAVKSPSLWTDDSFNHVSLVWDRSQGLTLYLNGKSVASNWGTDAWWTTQIPGLFHVPMCGLALDELWIFDRPLAGSEITQLMRDNEPPVDSGLPEPIDAEGVSRLEQAFVGPDVECLPVARPSTDGTSSRFREILPLRAGDGCVNAPFVMDGKYEMAWPMGYTSFTNILGDSDYQAEKVDFHLPPGSRVNYVMLEGNLTDARLLAGVAESPATLTELFAVPRGKQFFCGRMIEPGRSDAFRIPFVKGYGSPAGYAEGLHLPLTGDIRIHEVGFFEVREAGAPARPGEMRSLAIGSPGQAPRDRRYGYAIDAFNGRRDSVVLPFGEDGEDGDDARKWVSATPFQRLHLLSAPFEAGRAIKAVGLKLHMRNTRDETLAILRLHDPGGPGRVWTSVVFRLAGFASSNSMLNVLLDCTDIRAAAGDRIWLELAFSGAAEIEVGGSEGSRVLIETGALHEAEPRYGFKALQPALSSFTKIYPWYYPWIATGERPVPERPVTFGGFYDIVHYPQAVVRTDPVHHRAGMLVKLSLINEPVAPAYRIESWENTSRLWPPIPVTKADDSPDWAFHMRYYLTRFRDVVHWWADRQNPDGQVGGGWNDDVLFAARLPGPMLYCRDAKARRMFHRIFEGLETTQMFRDGYCNITPIDQMHVKDLVRNRYEGLLFDPGDPRRMKIAMRTAWRLGKPDKTPMNYAGGESFQYDHDLLLWYWGETPDYPAFNTTREQVTARVQEFAPAMNDVLRFRYTESGMFTDGFTMPGSAQIRQLLVGGTCGPSLPALTLAATWEQGGEPSIPKWVEHASDTRFVAHLYSYEAVERNVTARLLRLKKGIYRITLAHEGAAESETPILTMTRPLQRFSKVSVPVRPKQETVLRVELERELPDPGRLPDLAVHRLGEAAGRLRAEVLNLGAAPVGPFAVRLEDAAGRKLDEQTVPGLDSARTFVPAVEQVEFTIPVGRHTFHRVVVDPDGAVQEILEENNEAVFEQDGGDVNARQRSD